MSRLVGREIFQQQLEAWRVGGLLQVWIAFVHLEISGHAAALGRGLSVRIQI
jgi:hypothetical protein